MTISGVITYTTETLDIPSSIGEKKLSKVIVPDKWKEGASNTTEGGGRKINENKLLSKKNRVKDAKMRFTTGAMGFYVCIVDRRVLVFSG
ncbi:hypothetical protein RJT34_24418 [Clitoria ternatea]|uniref:Cysteine-rich PDZ-binding protein n=1 Tax=Clitoria ternatea TaxID=43366 RepID=A0AAN9IFV8_CLITE